MKITVPSLAALALALVNSAAAAQTEKPNLALVLSSVGGCAGEALALSFPTEGAAKMGAVRVHREDVEFLKLIGRSDSACPRAMPAVGTAGLERGRDEIKVAGPVLRTARRTSRRTSRRLVTIDRD